MRGLRLIGMLLLSGCLQQQFGVTVVPPKPDLPEPPRPAARRGPEPPAMAPTAHPGLTRAVAVVPSLYYFEPDDLWYTFFKGRWHQAFFWNGTWFEPERIPAVLLDLHRQSRKPDG